MQTVRPMVAGNIPAVAAIVRGLPDYFTANVPEQVEADAAPRAGQVSSGRPAGRQTISRWPECHSFHFP